VESYENVNRANTEHNSEFFFALPYKKLLTLKFSCKAQSHIIKTDKVEINKQQ